MPNLPTPPALLLPLTRAANLCDFDGLCASVGSWQQQHARTTVERWAASLSAPQVGRVAVLNWGSAPFVAPVPHPGAPDYYDRADRLILPDQSHAIIYALSVFDRAEAVKPLLRDFHRALCPGGLLLATFAIWDALGTDVALGHGLRTRIYDRRSWRKLVETARALGLGTFGGIDLRYPGDTIADHSLATLVCTKDLAKDLAC